MRAYRVVTASIFIACIGLCACALPSRTPASVEPGRARITVLYDAFGKNPALIKDWGYSALVEIDGKRILFDAGDNPDILANNVRVMNVDLSRLDFVVMSHRHGDHMGGLTYVLERNPKVKIYAPKENFGVYGFDLPGKFYRKSDTLPPEMRYYGGTPPPVMHFGTAFPRANIELIDGTTEVTPGITLIALVSDAQGTKELKELSLAIDTPDGVVLLVGCSHPGIELIVSEAVKIDSRIRAVVGGFHLVVAQDPVIDRVTATLHDTFKVGYIAPGHCTGEPTFAALRGAFGDRYLYAGLGTSLELRATGLARSGTAHDIAMDADDFRTYRAAALGSEDPVRGDRFTAEP